MKQIFLMICPDELLGLTGNIGRVLKGDTELEVDMAAVDTTYELSGDSAQRFWEWAIHPDRCQNLDPSEEVELYQSYCDRGGEISFDSWLTKYKRQVRLCALGNPTDAQLEAMSQLESELLL